MKTKKEDLVSVEGRSDCDNVRESPVVTAALMKSRVTRHAPRGAGWQRGANTQHAAGTSRAKEWGGIIKAAFPGM